MLSPVDAHYMEEGVYDFDVETSILKIENMDGDIINRYIVVEIAHDQLKMVVL